MATIETSIQVRTEIKSMRVNDKCHFTGITDFKKVSKKIDYSVRSERDTVRALKTIWEETIEEIGNSFSSQRRRWETL